MIIDTHSHIGMDYYCQTMTIEEYKRICTEIGVDVGFLMPTPWPCLIESEMKTAQLLWEHENYIKKHYFKLQNGKKYKITGTNPYRFVNDYYFNLISNWADDTLYLYFVPLVHGVLDTPDYLESLLQNKKIPAIKMHGFGSGFSIKDIRGELIEVLKYYDVPLILHTSVYNYNYGYGVDTKYFRNECHPLLWANFLVKHRLKGVLNHGACLNQEAVDLVNKYDNLMIGIGPDLDLSIDYFKADIDKMNLDQIGYLKLLKRMVDSHKLLFDLDYGWNIDPKTGNYDTLQLKRMNDVWNSNDIVYITSKNALSFYSKISDDPKIKKISRNAQN